MRLLRKLSAFEAWVILQERSWRGGIVCPQAEGGGDLRRAVVTCVRRACPWLSASLSFLFCFRRPDAPACFSRKGAVKSFEKLCTKNRG